jgi:hypothetical protein
MTASPSRWNGLMKDILEPIGKEGKENVIALENAFHV